MTIDDLHSLAERLTHHPRSTPNVVTRLAVAVAEQIAKESKLPDECVRKLAAAFMAGYDLGAESMAEKEIH